MRTSYAAALKAAATSAGNCQCAADEMLHRTQASQAVIEDFGDCSEAATTQGGSRHSRPTTTAASACSGRTATRSAFLCHVMQKARNYSRCWFLSRIGDLLNGGSASFCCGIAALRRGLLHGGHGSQAPLGAQLLRCDEDCFTGATPPGVRSIGSSGD
ncbi:hypothetical protein PHYPSEUDO_008276 [Phytophthora pseudosyringae]|uniref:Uncharacterized protein n=1 Tax=Phytophthora pseudosyringae TaxID=221518 RepID=A0A8T1VHJ3_9STRA|nr:hypothetical protein PHYPSEUDO_008276 [Phytophthora pseudosyringae]